jgi:hypothetical protein
MENVCELRRRRSKPAGMAQKATRAYRPLKSVRTLSVGRAGVLFRTRSLIQGALFVPAALTASGCAKRRDCLCVEARAEEDEPHCAKDPWSLLKGYGSFQIAVLREGRERSFADARRQIGRCAWRQYKSHEDLPERIEHLESLGIPSVSFNHMASQILQLDAGNGGGCVIHSVIRGVTVVGLRNRMARASQS